MESTTTLTVANTSPTAASTGADLNGKAAELACRAILGRLLEVAAEELATGKYGGGKPRHAARCPRSAATARRPSATGKQPPATDPGPAGDRPLEIAAGRVTLEGTPTELSWPGWWRRPTAGG